VVPNGGGDIVCVVGEVGREMWGLVGCGNDALDGVGIAFCTCEAYN
jgi:hypothetical protein